MAYCDFCSCEDCQHGTAYTEHARTADGRWICDVCYSYNVCSMVKRANGTFNGDSAPCDDETCCHRPLLVSNFF